MKTDFPTASVGSSQATTAAVEKSHSASHTEILTLPAGELYTLSRGEEKLVATGETLLLVIKSETIA